MEGSKDDNNKQLLEVAMLGSGTARNQLLERHRDQLRRMIAGKIDKRVAARVDPSDIVQDTLHQAYVRMDDYFVDPKIPFVAWLRRIALDRLMDVHRLHLDAQRRSVRREQHWTVDVNEESLDVLAQQVAASGIGPEQRAMHSEAIARTRAALPQLRPTDREILMLRYLEQLTVYEISEILGISQTSVTSRHLRALQRLRQLVLTDSEG
jgi:RNA polymerase sigma-70 factor (ECF subfamily)